MELAGPILVIAISIGGLLGFMVLVRRRAEVDGWGAEVQRKLVHVATGLYAIALPWLFAEDWPVYFVLGLTLVAMAAMRLPSLRSRGAGAALHSVDRRSWGDFLFVAAVALVFLLSQRDPLLYVLPLAVLALGDAAAALAGSTYGRRFFAVEGGFKSLEGSVVLFLVTIILAMVCLLLLSDIPRENVVILAFLLATFSTLVEADSWHGFDNLFLPLAVLIILREHGASSGLDLLILCATYLLALLVFRELARRFGLTPHVARVYLAAIFLLLSVTATQNAVFCVVMLVLHLVAERRAPSASSHPELDAVATLAVAGFGWLAVGHATGFNALDAFGASVAAMCAALAVLALAGSGIVPKLAGIAALAVVLPLTWNALMAFNPSEKHWLPNPGLIMLASALLAGGVALCRPDILARHRMVRIGALALLMPTLAFAVFAATFDGGNP